MFKKLVAKFVDDLIKAINTSYNIYNRLLSFEFSCLDTGLIGLMNFPSFYKMESLAIATTTMLRAEATKNVLDNKNVVRIAGSRRGKGRRERSINLFVIIVVVRLDNIYLARFLMLLLFTFVLRFIVTTFFSFVTTFTLFTAVFFVQTVFKRIYIALFESLRS